MERLPKAPKPDVQSKFYRAYRVMAGVTRIMGYGGENCYLIEGSERALLVDGLAGVGSLKAFVRELTDLPVSLALTHGHIDHAGMAWETGECYINPDDIALLYTRMHTDRQARLDYEMGRRSPGDPGNGCPATLADVPPACAVRTYPIYTGDVFDLGGARLEVIQVPGHTCGTVVFLDRARRIVFSGDACNPNTLLNLSGSTSIEEYLQSLKFFKTCQDAFDVMYGGHGASPMPNSIIDDGIRLCEDILAGRDDAIETPSRGGMALLALKRGANYLPERGGFCNIVYLRETLRRRPHSVIAGGPNVYR